MRQVSNIYYPREYSTLATLAWEYRPEEMVVAVFIILRNLGTALNKDQSPKTGNCSIETWNYCLLDSKKYSNIFLIQGQISTITIITLHYKLYS